MSNEEQVLEHTPGSWHYKASTIGHPDNPLNPIVDAPGHYICRLFSEASTLRGLTSRAPEHSSALGNASLIALAPTAPHRCNVPDCPGPQNLARLDAAEGLYEAISKAYPHMGVTACPCDRCSNIQAALAAYHAAQTEASPEVKHDN